ncbi:MAG: FHA domain-containing protein [Phycisphaerales bacterium]|nr:MAG: FHA domain-containing protein [Phycisphaerales bacterium]
MRLVVRETEHIISQLHFAGGPVYIGRHPHCQILLQSKAVSRQHAVLFSSEDGKWMIEDLNSANKTYLNGEAIHRARVRTGDHIRVGKFTIELDLAVDEDAARPTYLDDTLAGVSPRPRIIVRTLDFDHAPAIAMPARRVNDFLRASSAIGKAQGPDEMRQTLLAIVTEQFPASRAWCGFRYESQGPLTVEGGQTQSGQPFSLTGTALNEKVGQVLESRKFLLLPHMKDSGVGDRVQSALMGPLVGGGGSFGVLYLESCRGHEPYAMSDLDYLMLLSVHVAAVLEYY